MMVGGELAVPGRGEHTAGAPALNVASLNVASDERFGTDLRDISFTVHRSEIFGIAGGAGNGQSELLHALSGEQLAPTAAAITIHDTPAGHLGPAARRELGFACIPEDRLTQGAVADMSLADNLLLSATTAQSLTSAGLANPQRRSRWQVPSSAHMTCAVPGTCTRGSLSGGNLQKFITGRELVKRPSILVAAHPTWGVDAGAAAAIHQALLDLADHGTAVLVISQELDELMAICDRIAVIADGALGEAAPAHTLDAETIGLQMAGISTDATDAA